MAITFAVSGKGGSGKTTLASLIIKYLRDKSRGAVLAVDADANANLGEGLGLKCEKTIGGIIASFNADKMGIPQGLTKNAYLEIKLNEAIYESKGVDLITMGRGEGDGCYCYPNSMLRKFLDNLSGNYEFIVLDNEAGMEHLSRRTTEHVDELFLVSDHSIKGVRTLARIKDLIKELKLDIKHQSAIISAVPGSIDAHIAEELNRLDIQVTTTIPFDEQVKEYDLIQKPLLDLPDSSPAFMAVSNLMDTILGKIYATRGNL